MNFGKNITLLKSKVALNNDGIKMNKPQTILHLYRVMLGREASLPELQGYLKALKTGLSLYDIQLDIWNSKEFKSKFIFDDPVDDSTIENCVKLFVINLKRRPDRRQLITNKLDALTITNYEVIDAVDGQNLTEQDVKAHYDEQRARAIHRSMTKSEIGCALSHIECAKKIIENDLEYAVILEDDAVPTLQFKQFLKDFDINKKYNFDFLILGAFGSNQFFNGKLKTTKAPTTMVEKESIFYLDEMKYKIGNVNIHDSVYPTKELDFVHGTHGYIMSKAGAKKLIEINYPVIVEADNIWNYFNDSCCVEFTNPILCHKRYLENTDSDIHNERKELISKHENFSDSFLARKNHPDFGR